MCGEKKNSILIIDDEQANIIALTHILRPEYTVYAEKNAVSAAETAKSLIPDIILLDIVMPYMDGYDVLAALKSDEQTANIPVIFITGMSDIGSEEKGLTLGAVDYIIKPFVPVIVKLRVENQIKIIHNMRLLAKKQAEEQEAAARMKFLMDVSHESLTPMNVIMGMTEIARRSEDYDEIKDCLSDIADASKELLGKIMTALNTAAPTIT